ncbi:hypothetical protein GGI12_002039 [Dipsacomyces acuminosporus]|nr:hypothetical protein GGI12_002039 [Dipsacomyces acuminosporus]
MLSRTVAGSIPARSVAGASAFAARVSANYTAVRSQSTASSSEEYKGSSNYVSGKQGFAPGFPPPKKWRDSPRPKPAPRLPSDLAAPSAKHGYKPEDEEALLEKNPARVYKQKLKDLRFGYLHEHLVEQQRKRELRKESLEKVRKLHADRREKLRKERIQYETQVRADPLSAENVLNSEGKTLLPNIPGETSHADQHQPDPEQANVKLRDLETGYKLAPPRVSISFPKEANELRAKERANNRKVTEQRRHEEKVQTLMALFHEAESFVHYHNLEKKIFDFTNVLSVSHRTLGELVDDLNKNGGVTTAPEVARRTVELRNTLQGTTGRQGKLGYDGLVNWLDSHPEDAEGIIQVTKEEK